MLAASWQVWQHGVDICACRLNFVTIRDSVMCADSTAARIPLGLKMCA